MQDQLLATTLVNSPARCYATYNLIKGVWKTPCYRRGNRLFAQFCPGARLWLRWDSSGEACFDQGAWLVDGRHSVPPAWVLAALDQLLGLRSRGEV